MNRVVTTEKIPIKLWLNDIEDGAMNQAVNIAHLPFAFKHVAIMPDAHQGYGMPIGGVLATKGVIVPNAVGVDIGCGMCAVKTSLVNISKEHLKTIMGGIRKVVPVGFAHHDKDQDEKLMPKDEIESDNSKIVCREYRNALRQIGTLGGGNHFIEIQRGNDGFIWVMIHSGSRNLGKQVADYYNKLAVKRNGEWHSVVPKEHELAFLPIQSYEAESYKKEMDYCVEFALANRKLMVENIKCCITDVIRNVEFYDIINIAHNYAKYEHHFGTNVIIHRKGATSAKKGELGIIPGSQGTKSYIVRGLGNTESFMSCSHGAGRKMGRKQAQRELSLEDEIKKMNNIGVIHGLRNVADLDEAAGAYKDIDIVMANQKDLVEILIELIPLAVIKG
ncbi:MAG TPA: RtcB family protein [Ignavibacteriaceae bacterium]|nr:RtcB family protein [Ignavibacteriaceae bacterium]